MKAHIAVKLAIDFWSKEPARGGMVSGVVIIVNSIGDSPRLFFIAFSDRPCSIRDISLHLFPSCLCASQRI